MSYKNMKSQIAQYSLFLLVAFSSPLTQAQETNQPIKLDLKSAIEIALNDNPTIKIANLEIERQDYVRKETIGSHLPSLSASGSYTRSIVKQEMAKGLSFGADNTFAGSANLTLPLFAPSVYRTLQMNETQLKSAIETARSSKITLINEVKKGYYNILLAQQSLQVLYSSEKNLQETVDNTRRMYENELASEYDLLTAQVQLSNLQPTIIQTKNNIEIAKMLFRIYLNLPQSVDFILEGSLDDFSDTVVDGGQLNEDISGNSDLKSMELQTELLRNQLRVINSQRIPTIAAFGSATVTGNDMDMSALGFPGIDATSDSKYWWQHPISAGIQVSIPIFSGSQINSRVKQTRNSIAQLQLQRDYLEENVRMQVKSAINDIITAHETMLANEKTVSQAQKAYDISLTRYNAGAGTILELNSAEVALTQARLNYSQAIYNYLSAQADYEKIIGRNEFTE